MMKKIFSIATVAFFYITSIASNYYVSTSGSDANNGLATCAAFATFSKANSIAVAGDSIFFKRGDTFYGTNTITKSGSVGKRIYWGAYGIGTNPVFSNFVVASAWTNDGSGIWSFQDLALPALVNVVTIDGVLRGRGRFPKSGYLTYESHTGTTGDGTITDNQISGTPSYAGAEIVIRKVQWILDRGTITAHSGSVLSYTGTSTYIPTDGYGYFIQNHISTLTQLGDWMYDAASHKISMYFGSDSPSNHIIKISKADRNFDLSGRSYNTIQNIDVEGANQWGFYGSGALYTTINNCNITFSGQAGIQLPNSWNDTISNCTLTDMVNNGIYGKTSCDNWAITNNTLLRVGQIPGAGMSADLMYIGIYNNGDNCLIENNNLQYIGYTGIYFYRNNSKVRKNYINTFCNVKDDGGGIYTVTGTTTVFTQRYIEDNIVINAVGAMAGGGSPTISQAYGIYLDDITSNVTVQRNAVSNCEIGIFMHNTLNDSIHKNNFVNNNYGIRYRNNSSTTINGIVLDSNIVAAGTGQYIAGYVVSQNTFNTNIVSKDNKYLSLDICGNNFLDVPHSGTNVYTYVTFPVWKTDVGTDASTSLNAYQTLRFEYNNTAVVSSVSLGTNTYTDVYGNSYSGTLNLLPYSSIVLIKYS